MSWKVALVPVDHVVSGNRVRVWDYVATETGNPVPAAYRQEVSRFEGRTATKEDAAAEVAHLIDAEMARRAEITVYRYPEEPANGN